MTTDTMEQVAPILEEGSLLCDVPLQRERLVHADQQLLSKHPHLINARPCEDGWKRMPDHPSG